MKKKSSFDFVLFVIILILVCIGINMVFSASMYEDFYNYHDRYYHLKKQLLWVGIGTIAMFIAANFNYKLYKNRKIQIFGMFTTVALLVIVLFLPAVKEVHRWIYIGRFGVQPSEIAKLMIILYLADNIVRKGENIKRFSRILSILIIAGAIAALILKEPNMSNAVIVMSITFCMLFTSEAKMSHLILILIVGVCGATVLMFTKSYRAVRFLSFLNPWKDPSKTGFQAIQSLLALGAGNFFGVGIGMSHQKFYYIPEAQNDFIFSIIAEELGFIGVFFIIVLYILLVWRGLKIALDCENKFGTLVAVGITSFIAVQSCINFLVAASFMPVTGVPLPLVSYGGSSIVITMYALGILLNISRYKKE